MARHDLHDTVAGYKTMLERALGCITYERLSVPRVKQYELNRVYDISLNDFEPVPLTGIRLSLVVGEHFRIIRDETGNARIQIVGYTYDFLTKEHASEEALLFHWTPEDERAAVRFPHMHIGPALTSQQHALRPGSLHRAHIPTGRVSIEKIIWMTINEFGATPTHSHWENVLRKSEEEFERTRTR